ncbi:MAG: low molecular weight protein-tyrosine-phosphatase [Halieaceae bacterium]|jgi:protein-tyrosine phosphatase|nr:low molecular weight protein-tyrosine-phosphatase [Halieaceae bacterium]
MASVLFVCLGNICRSPTAHGIFQAQVEAAGLTDRIAVDSCGTGAWHVGEPPDTRATAAARARGYDLTPLRARQFETADFERFDHILAMDRSNLSHLEALRPADYAGTLSLFLDFHPAPPVREVPDPYYGGERGFEDVLDLVEAASRGLLEALQAP